MSVRTLAVIFGLLLAAPAQASTLSSEQYRGSDRGGDYVVVTYVFTGTAGADAVEVALDGQDLVFRDAGGIETSAAGCAREDGATVRCAYTPSGRALRADLGAGDDSIRFPRLLRTTIAGGHGNDRLEGTEATLLGGPGDDTLVGGEGGDDMDGGPGADVLDPGAGTGSDRLLYEGRTAGVKVDAGGDSAAGEAGEGDVVRPGFDAVVTGAGPDHVIAGPDGTRIETQDGDDVLEGGPGHDRLDTGDGADAASGRGGDDEIFGDDADFRKTPGRDVLDAGPGHDYVYGSAGPDVITGGPGRDHLIGGRGADRLLARDGGTDSVDCEDWLREPLSPGRDRAEVDAADFTHWCRHVARTGPGRTELLFAGEPRAKRRARGTARALLACTGRRACRGSLKLHAGDRRTAGHVRFRLAPGRRATIRIPFRLHGRSRSQRAQLIVELRSRDDAGVLRRTALDFSRRR